MAAQVCTAPKGMVFRRFGHGVRFMYSSLEMGMFLSYFFIIIDKTMSKNLSLKIEVKSC